jgi:hypothetical protein
VDYPLKAGGVGPAIRIVIADDSDGVEVKIHFHRNGDASLS